MKIIFIPFFLLSLIILSGFCKVKAQQPQWDWAQSFGESDFNEISYCVASDNAGNIYMTGNFHHTISFGNTTLYSSSYGSYFLAKFDLNGNALWAKTLFGGWSIQGSGICCDSSGNVFVTGMFDSGILAQTDTFYTYGYYDVFVIKYNSNGDELWIKQIGGTMLDIPAESGGCACEADGTLYVCGRFYGPELYVSNDTLYGNGQNDLYLIKFKWDGEVIWAKSIGGNLHESANDVCLDTNNNVYITGYFYSQTVNFGNYYLNNSGNRDFFLAKYNSQGNLQWAKQALGIEIEEGVNLECDRNQNVIVAGFSSSDTLIFDNNHSIFVSSTNQQVFIVKYDSLGNILWVTSPVDDHQIRPRICLDHNNNIYLSGRYYQYYNFGNVFLPGFTSWNIFVAKYNPDGIAQWASNSYGPSQDEAWSICSGPDNNLYVAGFMISSTVDFGNNTIYNYNSSPVYQNAFLAKLITPENLIDTQLVSFPQGWKIFSTYINPLEPSVDSVFSEVLPSVQIIKQDNGYVFYPQYNINMIGDIGYSEAYQINMSTPQIVPIVGYAVQPENTPLPLTPGWQNIPYLRNTSAPVDSMLIGISSNILIAKNSNGLVYWPFFGVNAIGQMIPGEGYQVKINQLDTLVYPAN